tara:strand:- start:4516 stop:4740 length:225 start_codon:yes stop_codon:yes gene_type:complete
MRKVTKTWKLWWMLGVYVLAIIGIIGLYAEYIVNQEINGFIQLLSTVVMLTIVGVFFSEFIKLLIKILKRKQLW